MSGEDNAVDEVDPQEAFDFLKAGEGCAMVDVRTRAEWTFVGLPDLSVTPGRLVLAEWVQFPSMAPNPAFVDTMLDGLGGEVPDRLFFICRSGARSLAAAQLVADEMAARGQPVRCTNVAEGFEGHLDAEHHRSRDTGWKARGLPWRQS